MSLDLSDKHWCSVCLSFSSSIVDHLGSVDTGEPIVNAVHSDSALIGGKLMLVLSSVEKTLHVIILTYSYMVPLWIFLVFIFDSIVCFWFGLTGAICNFRLSIAIYV